jgi:hypothetical protein
MVLGSRNRHQRDFENLSHDDFGHFLYWLVKRPGESDEVQ